MRRRFRPAVEPLEDRTLLDAAHWINPAGGDWNTPSNWSINRLPAAGDDVFIDVPGDVTITYSGNSSAIHSLTSQETVVLSGGTLSVSTSSLVNNFELNGNIDGSRRLDGQRVFSWRRRWRRGRDGDRGRGADGRRRRRMHTASGRLVDSTAGPANWLEARSSGRSTTSGR
jgi:hypothetical protein